MDRNRNEKASLGFNSNNPFVATPAKTFDAASVFADKPAVSSNEVAADAPEGSYTYALVKNGPEVSSEEMERAEEAVEILILWGSSVLHVAHLSPARSFFIGEENVDFVVPALNLGASRLPVVLVSEDKVARAIVPATAKGSIEVDGKSAAIDATNAEPCSALAGSSQIALRLGAKAKVEVGGLTIHVSCVKAGRAVKGALNMNGKGLPWHGVSLAVHVGLLAAAAFFVAPMGADDAGEISSDDKYFIQHTLDVLADKEQEKQESPVVAENVQNAPGGTMGARSSGSEGKMGSQTSSNANGQFAIQGPKDNVDPQVAKRAAVNDAQTFGMIGLLSTLSGGDPNAVSAPWGGEVSLGSDSRSALGNMWGSTLDDAAGAGGLGLSGHEEGGGGKGEGIGIDRIGTVGASLGGPGGFSRGLPQRAHKPSAPIVRPQGVTTSGRLPAEVIQRIVRQNFGRYRFCYEQGLRQNPNLAGRVAVKFVIGRDGGVSQVANGGSDMPDGNVVSCVVRSFYGLSFPQPDNGIVTVTYPIMFQPGS